MASTRRSTRRTASTLSYREATLSETDNELPAIRAARGSATKRKRAAPVEDEDEYNLNVLHGPVPASGSESDLSAMTAVDSDAPDPSPRKRRTSPKKKARTGNKAGNAEEEGTDGSAKKKRKRASPKKAVVEGEEGESPVKKVRKPRAPKPEPVYIIPDVEKRETTFRGRLGQPLLRSSLFLSRSHPLIQGMLV
jgi:UV DNA damage endonuclease